MFFQGKQQLKKLLFLIFVDWFVMAFVGGLSLLIRFDFSFSSIDQTFIDRLTRFLIVQAVVTTIVFWLRRMYHYIWRSVTVHDVMDMLASSGLAYAATCLVIVLMSFFVKMRLPISVYCMLAVFLPVFQVGMRCSVRFYHVFFERLNPNAGGERIMIIGAGEAGRSLLHEMEHSRQIPGRVCCLIDDNKEKWGKQLNGVLIVGGRDMIRSVVKKERITQIIFAIPSMSGPDKRAILDICKQTRCKIRTLPAIYQMVNGEAQISDIKNVQVEDLLGRDPVKLNTQQLSAFLGDRVVMVTGGGGSIGSELCRQIARYRPRQLIILDSYENNAYEIQQELHRTYGDRLELIVEIASVRDKQRTYAVVEYHRPDIIFHAAAHKHVPLMEACPHEAIKNNVFGTYHVVRAAEKFGVKKFVMISTDKAVNPTNFMGATKRFCEMILQSRVKSSTEFCAVRFGNVLGSNGSVVPLFKKQIEAGGPVTLTDKRIIRYFMTIPEAAQLVLQAGAMARQNQVFVLDMGEPVKILDLAENLIRLSGLEPYVDIQIEEVGLRPGEKLYEELLMKSERLTKTENEKIFVEEQDAIVPEEIMKDLLLLDEAVTDQISNEELIALMKSLVPTYHAPQEVNELVGAPG